MSPETRKALLKQAESLHTTAKLLTADGDLWNGQTLNQWAEDLLTLFEHEAELDVMRVEVGQRLQYRLARDRERSQRREPHRHD